MEELERDPREVLSLVVERAIEAKSLLCEENGGMVDSPPLLIGEFANGEGFVVPDLLEGHPTDTLPTILSGLFEIMSNKYQTPKFLWLAYVVEGYAKPIASMTKEDEKNHERGNLENEYKNNPATDIREGIIATVFPWEGDPLSQTILYRYNDSGLPVYDETQHDPSVAKEGAIPDLFRFFISYCHQVADAKNN